MEYTISETPLGDIEISFSMGAEALGRWFNDELGKQGSDIDQLLSTVLSVESGERASFEQQGREFTLSINDDEVEVYANNLNMESELPDETELYESELRSGCGLMDFRDILLEWRHFILNSKS